MKKFKITEKTVNFLLIFILGFLVGVAVKSEAQKRITIGFDDYLVPRLKQGIDLMSSETDAAKIPSAEGEAQNQPEGGSEQNAE